MNVTRRSFLVTAGAAAATPVFLCATDKAGNKPAILGEGEHKYEALHDWGELPHNIRYGNTHGVCEDSQGHIYVHHTVNAASESTDTMVVFDQKGKFVRSWGRQFKGGAHGLTIRKEGSEEFLYLCDYQHGIVTKRTLTGEEVFTLGYPEESAAYKPKSDGSAIAYRPTNIAIAPNGDIYVGDGYGSSFINQYNRKAEYHSHLCRTGQGGRPGRLSARSVGGHAPGDAGAGRDRPRQQPLATIYPRREAHRFHSGHIEDAVFPA